MTDLFTKGVVISYKNRTCVVAREQLKKWPILHSQYESSDCPQVMILNDEVPENIVKYVIGEELDRDKSSEVVLYMSKKRADYMLPEAFWNQLCCGTPVANRINGPNFEDTKELNKKILGSVIRGSRIKILSYEGRKANNLVGVINEIDTGDIIRCISIKLDDEMYLNNRNIIITDSHQAWWPRVCNLDFEIIP